VIKGRRTTPVDMRAELVEVLEDLGFDPDGLVDDTRLRDDLEVDSTEMTEIAVVLERRMLVKIDAAHFQTLKTFGDLVEFVGAAPARQ
jgi:acyl carrier protein